MKYVKSHNGYNYLRFPGQGLVKLNGEFGSEEFVASYQQALFEAQAKVKQRPLEPPKKSIVEGPAVYVFGFDQYVKIGFSKDFRKRRRGLEQGLPRALDIYLVIPGGSFETERELHVRFARYRLRGEWFFFDGELAEWIEAQVGIPDRRDIRRFENFPNHRLAAIRSRNKNEWFGDCAPNPWEVMAEQQLEQMMPSCPSV